MSLAEGWTELTTDGTEITYILYGFQDGSKQLTQVGKGVGLEDLTSKLDTSGVFFGAIRVQGVDKRDAKLSSTRNRYIAFVFVGEGVKGVAKMSALNNKDEVQRAFAGHTAWNQYEDPSDVSAEAIAKQLLAAGGAHKPTLYDFGAGLTINVSDLDGDKGESFQNDRVENVREAVEEKQADLKYDGPDHTPREAFQDLYNAKTDTNWILLGFKGKSKEIAFLAKGNGGFPELKQWFDENQIQFAAFSVKALGQEGGMEINRELLVQIDFIGDGVKGMAKMAALQARNSLRDIFTGMAFDERWSTRDEIDEHRIAKGLWAQVGGDIKPDRFDFGGDLEIPCSVDMQLQN